MSYKNLLFLIIGVGFLTRSYLVITLPLWHDEAYSIWASQQSFSQIVSGAVDPVHPPGYYLFVKLWSFLSDHLMWLRTSSLIFFVANCLLLHQIGRNILQKYYGLFLVFLYTFSGYFIVFDWQVRMYTGILTLILLSFNLLVNQLSIKKWFLFVLINAFGLYFDYAFMWYFLPLLATYFFLTLYNHSTQIQKRVFALLLSLGLFLLMFPQFWLYWQPGIGGIEWVRTYMSPSFSIPYFLGTHYLTMLIPFFLGLFLGGLYIIFFYKTPVLKKSIGILLILTIVSGIVSYIYSLLFSPLFHVRSLQIIGLSVLLIQAMALYKIKISKYSIFLILFLFAVILNFTIHILNLNEKPGRYLIQFFPWKKVAINIQKQNISYVIIGEAEKYQQPLLKWGLLYTLNGKETIFTKQISYKEGYLVSSLPISCVSLKHEANSHLRL